MQLVVGRIARAHGIAGEVAVEVRTDAPDERFAVGTAVDTDPPERGPLTVRRSRWHQGRLLVAFDSVADRDAADALRGTLLVVDSASSPPTAPDEYWDHDLVGLSAVLADGTAVGDVEAVLHPPGPAMLSIRQPDGAELLVPFVRTIVPTVDVRRGRLVVDPPDGLLDL